MNESRERVVALAVIMTEADCASNEYPFSDESRARAILAAGYRSPVEVEHLLTAARAEALRDAAARIRLGLDTSNYIGQGAEMACKQLDELAARADSIAATEGEHTLGSGPADGGVG